MGFEKPALAAELDRIRRERGYSVRDLSDLSQINYTYVSKILAGRHIPSPNTLGKLTDALQVPITGLMQLYEDLPQQMLDRLVQEQSSGHATAARGFASAQALDDSLAANLPPVITQALRDIGASGGGAQGGIGQILQSIAKVEPREKREELIKAMAALVKCYVQSGDDDR